MARIDIRLDDELKLQAEKLFKRYGLNFSKAINLFLQQAVENDSAVFEFDLLNSKTIASFKKKGAKTMIIDNIIEELKKSEKIKFTIYEDRNGTYKYNYTFTFSQVFTDEELKEKILDLVNNYHEYDNKTIEDIQFKDISDLADYICYYSKDYLAEYAYAYDKYYEYNKLKGGYARIQTRGYKDLVNVSSFNDIDIPVEQYYKQILKINN